MLTFRSMLTLHSILFLAKTCELWVWWKSVHKASRNGIACFIACGYKHWLFANSRALTPAAAQVRYCKCDDGYIGSSCEITIMCDYHPCTCTSTFLADPTLFMINPLFYETHALALLYPFKIPVLGIDVKPSKYGTVLSYHCIHDVSGLQPPLTYLRSCFEYTRPYVNVRLCHFSVGM